MTKTIRFVYFKVSGKFYSEGTLTVADDDPTLAGCITPRDYGETLCSLERLPGLARGTWEGPMVVEMGYPELVMPKTAGVMQ